jgi:spermidine/putrescine transport system substrate-binding protein
VTDFERDCERFIRAEITRRRLLRRGAAGALSVSALSYLAACGSETGGGDDDGGSQEQQAIKKSKIADSLYVANWPLYIDEKRDTLKRFEKEYGTKVKYVEEINDNTEFFGKVRQQYERGDS